MGHGEPTCGSGAGDAITPLVSLGADCNSNNRSTMLHSMQLYLAVVRSHRNSRLLSQGRFPQTVYPRTEIVFNMATIEGARAIGMESKIGSLRPGKQADIVIFDAASPAMVPAADANPLVAVVRHASPAEVETVIVAGEIRKRNGVLVPAAVRQVTGWNGFEKINEHACEGVLPWTLVAERLRESRRDILQRASSCNMEAAKRGVMGMLGLSKDQLENEI